MNLHRPPHSPTQPLTRSAVLRVSSPCLFLCWLFYCQYCSFGLGFTLPPDSWPSFTSPLSINTPINVLLYLTLATLSSLLLDLYLDVLFILLFFHHFMERTSAPRDRQRKAPHTTCPTQGQVSHCSLSLSIAPFFHFSIYLFICTQS